MLCSFMRSFKTLPATALPLECTPPTPPVLTTNCLISLVGRSINTALDDASELPPKRRCVVRPDLPDQAVKYFEDRYDTLMKMRDMVIAEGDAGAVQEVDGEQQRRLLIGKVFITACADRSVT